MPTENRSSNTEMVSVPREPSAQMLDAARNAPVPMVYVDSMRARQDLEFSARYKAAISQCTQLAPTTHPDPIAWMVGTAFWWTKEEAERDAADTGLPIVGLGPMAGVSPAEQHQGEPVAWRYLESDAESGAYYKPEYSENRWHEIPEKTTESPLYLHADPAEFEQLRLERDALRSQLNALEELSRDDEVERLRAELTDTREAYLNQSARLVKANQEIERLKNPTFADTIKSPPAWVRAALSASAEPSALPDPLGCNDCTHAECGRFDGPHQVECRAMADNACARPGASS
ncbi:MULTISPECIES: hypothetical protein [Pseudomonas]|uniref:Uncharacterized protein n=1 Tax=Pseudomonas putida (strain ATCC 47054 / DSM 6125 / CFBP 8728 / NCIMB 11950 / KT2440) TaxID=160488 RepID=Q88MN2_PSEPK|nr:MULTISPECIES: hypothetical protein [Pseudomonas]AAN67160.2 conserved protein of unknown function [Pseudomonas putida KT2440]MDD2078616.1 hypothetical protein [Pseudomonas putida]PXZ52390.1 hypothetical protein DM483_06685 [Pseudomonas sp. SMT-1]QDW59602.1 hypothetical protein FFH79_023295 [Pseudomonas sp. KBS0802]QXZ02735.1 hypothetical protein HG554_07945 [Pseudomonas putida]